MQTALELFEKYFKDTPSYYEIERSEVLEIINIARKEAIEECAREATSEPGGNWESYGPVDKESILSLIKELK
jgi:hypothetical protein